MGYLARSELVVRGLRDAAVSTTITTRANEFLNSWLRSQYVSWPWPFLRRHFSGLAWATGVTSKVVGASNGGITPWIQRIYDPLYVYTSAYTTKQKARVEHVDNGSISDNDIINDPTKHTGIPDRFVIYVDSTTPGALDLIPNRFPDRDLLIAFDYLELPLNIDETSGGDTTKPYYPNDQTMIQAVKAYALDFDKRGQESAGAFQALSSMLQDDRIKFGSGNGHNTKWSKDPSVYRGR